MKKRVLEFFVFIILISPLIYSSNFLAYSDTEQYEISYSSTDYSNWFWTDIEVLSESDDATYNVEMAIDESNNIHVVWQDETDDLLGSGSDIDVFYKNWNYETDTWSSVELVSTEGIGHSEHPFLAIDSQGSIHVVWSDYSDILGADVDIDIFHRKRSSSGVWSSYTLLSDVSDGLSQEMSIVIDSIDNVYVVWSDPTDVGDLGGIDRDIFYNIYDDLTSTWSGMTLITDDSSAHALEPWLAIDSNDFVHLVWTDLTDMYGAGTDYDIFYKRFLSSYYTWSQTQLVSTESNLESRDSHMCLDSENSVHVAWHDETIYQDSGIDYDIFYKVYESSQSTWTSTEVISIYSDAYSALPKMAIDDSDTLHLVWEDLADYGGYGSDWDIVYQYKEKEANFWSPLTILSLDPDDVSYEPRVHVDNLNHLHFIWYDNTEYLGSGLDYDIFYRKFVGPPEATTLESFDTDIITIGNLTLTWQYVSSAENYEVYRENTHINSYSALIPIAVLYSRFLSCKILIAFSIEVARALPASRFPQSSSLEPISTKQQGFLM